MQQRLRWPRRCTAWQEKGDVNDLEHTHLIGTDCIIRAFVCSVHLKIFMLTLVGVVSSHRGV